jgi:transposase InsO family protein
MEVSLTGQNSLNLVVVLDVFSRRAIGWALTPSLDAPVVIAALRMALCQRHPRKALIGHSDRGAQFASAAYRQVLSQHGLVASMSRPGNCYDNAFIESFWSTLKYELVYHHRFATRAEARTAIFVYRRDPVTPRSLLLTLTPNRIKNHAHRHEEDNCKIQEKRQKDLWLADPIY